ncbi:MAG TPA: hypothetical protein VGR00_05805 [Thermoanaerobaculia bacterium]|nr:hypothetical protein [Thermoanaerobaculia bacterium]
MRNTNRILPLALLAASLPALGATKGTNVGTFSAGERVSPPGFHAPEHVSRMYVKTVLPDGDGHVTLPAVGDSSLIVWTMPLAPSRSGEAARVSGSLRTPAGRRFAAGDEGSTALGLRRFAFDEADLGIDLPKGTHEVIHVEKAEPGLHALDLSSTSSGALVVVAEPDSRLVLATWAGPLSHVPGEPVTLHAELTNGGAALAGARVTARLAAPGAQAGESISLTDSGNGSYSATIADLPGSAAGLWTARFEVEGRDAKGVSYARTGSAGLVNEPGAARLDASSVRATFVGRGEERVLRITARTDVRTAGDYRLDVAVSRGDAAADGSREGVAWAESTDRLERGSRSLSLEIPARLVSTGADGALHVEVRLLGLDAIGVAGRTEVEVR